MIYIKMIRKFYILLILNLNLLLISTSESYFSFSEVVLKGGEPLSFARIGDHLYILKRFSYSDPYGKEVDVYDLNAQKTVKNIKLDHFAYHLKAMDNRVWVHGYSSFITVIDNDALEIEASSRLFTPIDKIHHTPLMAWCWSKRAESVVIFDTHSLEKWNWAQHQSAPFCVFDIDDRYWVLRQNDKLLLFSGKEKDNHFELGVPLPEFPDKMVRIRDKLWIMHKSNHITIVDINSKAVVKTIQIDRPAVDIKNIGEEVWVLLMDRKKILIFDEETLDQIEVVSCDCFGPQKLYHRGDYVIVRAPFAILFIDRKSRETLFKAEARFHRLISGLTFTKTHLYALCKETNDSDRVTLQSLPLPPTLDRVKLSVDKGDFLSYFKHLNPNHGTESPSSIDSKDARLEEGAEEDQEKSNTLAIQFQKGTENRIFSRQKLFDIASNLRKIKKVKKLHLSKERHQTDLISFMDYRKRIEEKELGARSSDSEDPGNADEGVDQIEDIQEESDTSSFAILPQEIKAYIFSFLDDTSKLHFLRAAKSSFAFAALETTPAWRDYLRTKLVEYALSIKDRSQDFQNLLKYLSFLQDAESKKVRDYLLQHLRARSPESRRRTF